MFVVGARSKPGQKRTGAAVRGANNGKLLPGEKKRLKRERMNAKRAARSAAHGLDLESINAELVQFVATDGDMKVQTALLPANGEPGMMSTTYVCDLSVPSCLLQSPCSCYDATLFCLRFVWVSRTVSCL